MTDNLIMKIFFDSAIFFLQLPYSYLQSFADPEPDVTNFRPKFVIPTISIELVDDECPSGTDDIEGKLVSC